MSQKPAGASGDEHRLIAERRRKLDGLRETGFSFPNDRRRTAVAAELLSEYGEQSNEMLEAAAVEVSVAGRLMAKRVMGKASFAKLQDRSGQIQIRLQRDLLGDDVYKGFLFRKAPPPASDPVAVKHVSPLLSQITPP